MYNAAAAVVACIGNTTVEVSWYRRREPRKMKCYLSFITRKSMTHMFVFFFYRIMCTTRRQ